MLLQLMHMEVLINHLSITLITFIRRVINSYTALAEMADLPHMSSCRNQLNDVT